MSISQEDMLNKHITTQFNSQNKPRTLQYFIHGNEKSTINLDPSYQRGEVWCNNGKKELIYSLFSGISLPPVILNQHGIQQVFDVIDGKQRLTTIIGFIKNHFPIILSNNTKLYFSEIPDDENKNCMVLNEDFQEDFKNIEIQTTIYQSLTEEHQRDIFERINYGSPLKDGEKLKGSKSKGIDLIEKLINKYGSKLTEIGIQNERDSHYLKFGTIIALINKDYKCASAGKPVLDYFNNWNKDIQNEREIYNNISTVLDRLYSLHINLDKYHSARTSTKFKKMNFCEVLFNIYYLINIKKKIQYYYNLINYGIIGKIILEK